MPHRSLAGALLTCVASTCGLWGASAQQAATTLPQGPLVFGAFEAEFSPEGNFRILAEGWPPLQGLWEILPATRSVGSANTDPILQLRLQGEELPEGCSEAGHYTFRRSGTQLALRLVEDTCRVRQMILGQSDWRPRGEPLEVPPRRIELTVGDRTTPLPEPAAAKGSWPSFRGTNAAGVAEGMGLPDTWDLESGAGIRWRIAVEGLAHASPVVWGDRLFLTTAISSRGDASFRPGLYGDGDAATDRSNHRFEIWALDKHTGKLLWKRLAREMVPLERRHIKATYANATPATDGRLVVAWFGSQGVHAFDVLGTHRWSLDLGHLDLGAYDVPSYEWGPASSPILWRDRVFLQVDTQADSFVIALDATSGATLWQKARDELPTWGTPTLIEAGGAAQLVTNGAKLIRSYDALTGELLWQLGGSSKITAPTPFLATAGSSEAEGPLAKGLIVVASGRAPERPIFAVRPAARGDLTLPRGVESSDAIAWSKQRRGPYMPTPIAYRGRLYVLANNGVLDAYELATGAELFRQRLTHGGSGFSASPVAADGKLYLASEDGDILIVAAEASYRFVAANDMNDLLMATPALSDGTLYVRSAGHLTAIGRN